ncbi:MAG: DUF2274 domain-containing protein [Caulobacteraceae bacterium]
MPDLKIGRLPDRKPVKYTFEAWPDLSAALEQYAAAYRVTYGEAEPVAELIPFMLDGFLKSDRTYLKVAVENTGAAPLPAATPGRRRREECAPGLQLQGDGA